MKSLMMLWQVLAQDLGQLCSVSTTRDIKTFARRVEHEGLSFLTITLPAFCKDLEKGLSDEQVTPDLFPGFARQAELPKFLGGFLELVFDRASGRLLPSPSIDAIYAVRQLALVLSKVELEPAARRVRAAIEGFWECEQDVKKNDAARSDRLNADFRQTALLLWGDVLSRVDKRLYEEANENQGFVSNDGESWPFVVPHHGPGKTADRRSGNRKFDVAEWTQRLEKVFPSGEYLLPSWRYRYRLDRVDILDPGAERPVRVITVPKTMKTPRIIAIEPTCMQYMQQGIKDVLVDAIRGDNPMGRIVGFDDQHRNRLLAQKGSVTGSLATLDLSEASDRVSNQLVREMCALWPHVAEAVDATRSRKADVPGIGVLRLAKFASMGSALTFPIEAMVFATVVFLGISRALNRRLTRADVSRLAGQVRVYGDDIIVPVDYALPVVECLEAFGFKVNSRKSFWSGKFRESCGREYYAGHDVSVVRLRHAVQTDDGAALPSQPAYVQETESLVDFRNKMYLSGCWRVAKWLDSWIEPLLGGWYPTVTTTTWDPEEGPTSRCPLLSRWTVLPWRLNTASDGMCHDLHVPLVRGWRLQPKTPESPVSGEGALLKVLSSLEISGKSLEGDTDPLAWLWPGSKEKDHLERTGRPDAVRIKLRWAQPW